jgi:RNA polymerase sigma factor (sigma-70 family)
MSLVLLRTQTDERLVALAREGHERAFEAIVKRYRRSLLAAARRMVPEARAEDVLQHALVSAWGALRRGDEVRDLRAWLFRIVRNAAVSHLRRADPPDLLETLVAAPSPQEEAERRAVVHETLAAVASLPERQREALLRIAVQGHSQDEVADELGVSKIAVRQLVHRARTSLRAAASAAVPFPIVAWLAAAGSGAEPMSLRIAQLVTGAGGAGAAATLLKAGAVAGVAATAVSAPILAQHHAPRVRPVAAEAAQTATPTPTPTPAARPLATPVKPHHVAVVPARRGRGGDDWRSPTSDDGSRGGGDDRQRTTTRRRSGGDDPQRSGDDGTPDHSTRSRPDDRVTTSGGGGSGDDATHSGSFTGSGDGRSDDGVSSGSGGTDGGASLIGSSSGSPDGSGDDSVRTGSGGDD